MKLHKLIETIENEIADVIKENPACENALKWEYDEREMTIFDCGYFSGLKAAIDIIERASK
tara:strand:+ start:28 stop:210 length:183 start_codon:yes stop_codon:yes gene_type:complete